MITHAAFAGVLVLQKDANPFFKWIFEITFLKHSMDEVLRILFQNRGKLECDIIYCHFKDPEVFLDMIDAPKDSTNAAIALPIILIFMHIVAYYNVNKRLKSTKI